MFHVMYMATDQVHSLNKINILIIYEMSKFVFVQFYVLKHVRILKSKWQNNNIMSVNIIIIYHYHGTARPSRRAFLSLFSQAHWTALFTENVVWRILNKFPLLGLTIISHWCCLHSKIDFIFNTNLNSKGVFWGDFEYCM